MHYEINKNEGLSLYISNKHVQFVIYNFLHYWRFVIWELKIWDNVLGQYHSHLKRTSFNPIYSRNDFNVESWQITRFGEDSSFLIQINR